MHATSFIALLSLATSAWTITVTQPSQGATWDSSGTNTIAWTEVSTDPTTFAATLVQFGTFQKTLVDNIDGTKGSVSVSMTGLPTGMGFQVNLVKSSQDLNTILAQSQQFNITAGGGSSSAAASTDSGTGTSTVGASSAASSSTGAGSAASSTGASLATALPNASSTSANPTASHSSAASTSSHGGLMGILLLFGLALVY